MEWHNKSRVPAHNALGDQEGRLLEKGTGRLAGSPNNLQLRLHRFIQQINRLLKPFVLYEGGIRLLCCLDRSMVCVANSYSSSNWMLEKTATILLPGVTVQRNRLGDSVTADFRRRVARRVQIFERTV